MYSLFNCIQNRVDQYYRNAIKGIRAGTVSSYVNAVLASAVYHKLSRKLKELKLEGWMTHYTSNSITPLLEADIVTIHDTGFTSPELYKRLASYYRKYFILNRLMHYPSIVVPSVYVKGTLQQNGIEESGITVIPRRVRDYI